MRPIHLASIVLAAVLLLAQAGAALAQDEGEFLYAKPPAGWKLGFENDEGKVRVREYIPEGEAIETWTNMIVVQVFGDKAHIAPKDLAGGMFSNYKRGCGKAEFGMMAEGTQNGYEVFSVMIQCKDPKPEQLKRNIVPRKLQVNWVKIFRGAKALYLVQRQWRADTPGADYPLRDEDALKPWARFMRDAELCDIEDYARTCRFLGHLSNLEAQSYARRLPSPYNKLDCSYFVSLVVRPDPALEILPRAVVPVMLGQTAFLEDENGQKAFEQVASKAADNAGVALIFTVGKTASKTVPVDFERAREEARSVREARMIEVFNPACSG